MLCDPRLGLIEGESDVEILNVLGDLLDGFSGESLLVGSFDALVDDHRAHVVGGAVVVGVGLEDEGDVDEGGVICDERSVDFGRHCELLRGEWTMCVGSAPRRKCIHDVGIPNEMYMYQSHKGLVTAPLFAWTPKSSMPMGPCRLYTERSYASPHERPVAAYTRNDNLTRVASQTDMYTKSKVDFEFTFVMGLFPIGPSMPLAQIFAIISRHSRQ